MKLSVSYPAQNADSYRAARVNSLFNVEGSSGFQIEANLPIDDLDWRIGLIVGPSGSGKTSLGRSIFPGVLDRSMTWPEMIPIIDAIRPDLSFDEVSSALSGVGLGSVPTWLRPYHVLSNGEKFRADLARIVCDRPSEVVIDEFTSVVDRQVAKAGAAAFSKSWRRGEGRAVLLSCHYDIIEWVEPDWVFDTATGVFAGRCHRRPKLELEIRKTSWEWWRYFEPHHYLKLPKMIAADCYVGFIDGAAVAHVALSPRPGLVEARAARFVVMPDYQGIGIGVRFLSEIARLWRNGENRYGRPMPTMINTSHPGLAASLRKNPLWAQISAKLYGDNKARSSASLSVSMTSAAVTGYGGHFRATQGFRYIDGIDLREG